jgi:hypothetical protein
MGRSYAPPRGRQEPVLAPAVGFEGAMEGIGAGLQVINRAGSGQVPGRSDHPDGELVMWDA